MFYGVAYYPEHKTEEELEHDIRLLVESGVNTVRMGEFAWCRFEPCEGEFCFDWLDHAVERLGRQGVKSIICTPTACPPAWMVQKHPDMMYVDNRGVTRPFGGRRHYCYNNEVFRDYSRRIARAIGEHYGKNPYVAGFQIDNEPAQEGTGRCHCSACTHKFRRWMENKYQTVEEFNRRSGGVFWSQEIDSFSQISPPVNSIEVGAQQQIIAFYENPTVRMDFERFSSESQVEYQNIQAAELRRFTHLPVTTNATGVATNSIDYYQSTKELDCYGFDYYPGLRDARVDSFPYAFARGIKSGKPFWVLEFMSGGGHRLSGSGRLQPNPGALKQAVVHAMAHGAEMMLHFQFRTFPFGAEQLNYAIVDMDGVPRRRYYEMQETASLLKKLEPLEKAAFCNQAAVCFDYDTYWALRIKPVNDPDFDYIRFCTAYYDGLSAIGVNADVISLQQDWSRYKLVVLPSVFVMRREIQEKAKAYVKNGGTLIATFLTSVKNEDNVGYTNTLPAGLTDLFGVTVEEVEPVFPQNVTCLELAVEGQTICAQDAYWSELLDGKAEMIGRYAEDYKKDKGVVSCQKNGAGAAYYVGTGLEKGALQALLRSVCKNCGIVPHPFVCDENVEVVCRKLDGNMVCFLFNFTGRMQQVTFPGRFKNSIDGVCYDGSMEIDKNGFAAGVLSPEL